MAGNPRLLGLLEEMLDSGKTPEEVCRDCLDLLPEVRRRWQDFCHIDAEIGALLPGLRTRRDGDAIAPGPLGLIKRLVCFPHQRLDARRPDGGLGNADADGQMQLPLRNV